MSRCVYAMAPLAVCLLVSVTLLAEKTLAQEEAAAGDNLQAQFERRVNKALETRLSAEFVETPLSEVAAYLSEKTGIDIALDENALADVGVESDNPVSLNLQNVSFRSLLRLLLEPLELTWNVHDEALFFTTMEQAEGELVTRVYHVLDLIQQPGQRSLDADTLIELISSTIAPESWDDVGGPGSLEAFREVLVVSQTREVQAELPQLLAVLRKVIKQYDGDAKLVLTESIGVGATVQESQLAKLIREKRISLEFVDASLAEVASYLSQTLKQNVLLDARALNDVAVDGETTVSIQCKNVTVQSALRRMLKQLDLTYVIRDEVLLITTPESSEAKLVTRLYPVRDLVGGNGDARYADYDSLIELVTSTIEPSSWDEVGGPGGIDAYPRSWSLVIPQTERVQEQIDGLLQELRAARKATSPEIIGELEKLAQQERARVRTVVYAFRDEKAIQEGMAKDLAEVTREFLLAACPDKKDLSVRAVGNRIVVQADSAVQMEATMLLQKFDVYSTAAMGFGGFSGGGQPTSGGGFFNVRPQP